MRAPPPLPTLLIVLLGLTSACGGGESDAGATPTGCSEFTPANVSPYMLPWHIGQSFTAYPHLARESSVQRYAIDAPMPIGTDVLAMRAGSVVRVEESFFDGDNV